MAGGPQGHTPRASPAGAILHHQEGAESGDTNVGHQTEQMGQVGSGQAASGPRDPESQVSSGYETWSVPAQDRHFAESHSAKALGDFTFP